MKNGQNASGCCCKTTQEETKQQIKEIAAQYKGRKDSLIQVLHIAQELYGHLPLEVQQIVAEELEIPTSTVSGVVSFYSYFSTQPRGKHVIRVCLGTACYVRGGKRIVEELNKLLNINVGDTTKDGLFTLNVARCIGACGLAPAMTIDDEVYRQVNPDKLETILARYCQEGREAEN